MPEVSEWALGTLRTEGKATFRTANSELRIANCGLRIADWKHFPSLVFEQRMQSAGGIYSSRLPAFDVCEGREKWWMLSARFLTRLGWPLSAWSDTSSSSSPIQQTPSS